MIIILTIAVVVAVLLGFEWLHRRGRFYQYLFFCRVPLLAGMALTLLPIAAVTLFDELIGNWFASVGMRDAAIIAFIVLLSARTLCYLVQIVFQVAPLRTQLSYTRPACGTETPATVTPSTQAWPQTFVVLALLIATLPWGGVILGNSEQPWSAAGGLLVGTAAFVALLLAFRLHTLRDGIDEFGRRSGRLAVRALASTAAFLCRSRPPEAPAAPREEPTALLRRRAAMAFTVFLFLYLAGFWFGHPEHGSPAAIPLVVYPLLIITLAALLLTFLTSRLDSRRIPVALVALGWPILCYSACDTDHEYALLLPPAAAAGASRAPDGGLDEAEFARTWMASPARPWSRDLSPDAPRIPIIVTSSGGGMSAAYWTACVLDLLRRQPDSGDSFARSLLLASTVSGGSAGAAFWLQEYAEGDVTCEASAQALRRSGVDCLSAIAWGLAYPDTMRLVLPALASDRRDRGWSLEAAWRRAGMDPDASLLSWRREAAAGLRPTTIFNATLTETGQRLMIALHDVRPSPREDGASAQSWLRLYRGWDLRIATAARLSATFPYVAPVARPAWSGGCELTPSLAPGDRYHVADGGYYDNDGVASALDFLDAALGALRSAGAEGLLLVRIRADQVADQPEARDGAGWKSALFGPVLTMLKVRTTSQVDRNRSQLTAMLENWRGADYGGGRREFPILDVTFELPISSTLSWYLTDCEKKMIRDSLASHADDVASIAGFLDRRYDVQQKAAK